MYCKIKIVCYNNNVNKKHLIVHDCKCINCKMKMLKKYIVTIMCDETKTQIILKSKMTKKQLHDVLCKMYDEYDLCEINETTLIFDYAYVVTNTITHKQLKRCYYANNKCC